MKSIDFYQDLQGFTDFKGMTRDANFKAVPEDWKVIITDVKGSTKAIEAGRYKDVNTIGAATIVSAHNALGALEFPYVFGGDGATLLIPAEYEEQAKVELTALKKLSESQFGLELRTGLVGVDELVDEGSFIEVAKFLLVGKKSVAFFRGGGLSLAEKKVKGDPGRYEFESDISGSTNLQKLSCRWKPIPAKRGRTLSLLVSARGENGDAIYRQVIEALDNVFEGQLDQANPVNTSQMSYNSFGESYQNEKRLHASPWSFAFIRRVVEIAASVLIFRLGIPPLIFNPKQYADSFNTHSDYRKFDDMLRMVLDCSAEQAKRIQSFLDDLYHDGKIYYGLHESDNSLMTCFVDWLGEGEHIHFIDGGNGGYAMAAKHLKAQLRAGEN
ncbi:DUF3095 domain-containing protein [Rubellicoccus peritrichatus]|uniref:DUF3095 domain-containing protein n=1 Tax=Rubellicoccus peritrichatus TaxID=3080537 RepID=A0AAQ3L8I5_9BACT|nr:DUF3095 domain-containing protein [Puniceicoccus sp. CR14]WOO41624.1 DUF3095 domain-containing protein [Puniceicoccus sp. CR14]